MNTGIRAWRGMFLALALLVTAGALSACDDAADTGTTPPPAAPTQN